MQLHGTLGDSPARMLLQLRAPLHPVGAWRCLANHPFNLDTVASTAHDLARQRCLMKRSEIHDADGPVERVFLLLGGEERCGAVERDQAAQCLASVHVDTVGQAAVGVQWQDALGG